jgi:hypothetical protein
MKTGRVEVWRREGHGKSYCRLPMCEWPLSIFKYNFQTELAVDIERELNEGLLCEEAEIAWPRLGKHNKPTFKVHTVSAAGNRNI